MHPALLSALLLAFLATSATAQTCSIDRAAVEARIADLESRYVGVLSDIGCDNPTLPAHQLMCGAATGESGDDTLWRMGRLNDLAWVHAVENATGQDVDETDPPRDPDFLARRDACTDVACLCGVLIQHTNDSLGGTSPYPQDY
ncbi:MAG: hypothetical protein ACK4FR_03695 [Tabrizicola sp.]